MHTLFLTNYILVPKTCDDLKKLGVVRSGAYLIDPDGAGIGDAPITVDCDMTGDPGMGIIII
jgi:hypothetical protein